MLEKRAFTPKEVVWVFAESTFELQTCTVLRLNNGLVYLARDIHDPLWIHFEFENCGSVIDFQKRRNPEFIDVIQDTRIITRVASVNHPLLLQRANVIDLKRLSDEGKNLVSEWHPYVGLPLDTKTKKQDTWNQFWKQLDIQKLLKT
jgi:hypothetical protein